MKKYKKKLKKAYPPDENTKLLAHFYPTRQRVKKVKKSSWWKNTNKTAPPICLKDLDKFKRAYLKYKPCRG